MLVSGLKSNILQVSPFKNDMRYKENEKYLARVQASVDAERSHRDKVKLEREKKREYQATRAALQQLVEEERAQKQQEKNDRASEFWIATVGVGVVSFINTIKRGFTNAVNQSALTIHAYSLTTRSKSSCLFLTSYRQIHFPISKRATARFVTKTCSSLQEFITLSNITGRDTIKTIKTRHRDYKK